MLVGVEAPVFNLSTARIDSSIECVLTKAFFEAVSDTVLPILLNEFFSVDEELLAVMMTECDNVVLLSTVVKYTLELKIVVAT